MSQHGDTSLYRSEGPISQLLQFDKVREGTSVRAEAHAYKPHIRNGPGTSSLEVVLFQAFMLPGPNWKKWNDACDQFIRKHGTGMGAYAFRSGEVPW